MTERQGPCAGESAPNLEGFRATVLERGTELYRDLPWRRTRDPYEIWISEVMLQQTQTSRVDGRWQRWLERFPSVATLASAPSSDVLSEWQGLGYNRRALAVHRAAQVVCDGGGDWPADAAALKKLPGIGPATAAGILAFAFDLHAVYLETNVRAVFLHELFPGQDAVSDRVLVPLVDACCPADAADPSAAPGTADDSRTWYYALLDYGAYLKRTLPNPSRRSASYAKQSRFEGSHRQKRAELLRIVLAAGEDGADLSRAAAALNDAEIKAGRGPLDAQEVGAILGELVSEGFCYQTGSIWRV